MKKNSPAPVKPTIASGMIEEIKKVTWPTRAETFRLTIIVIAISLIIGLYIGIIDIGFARLLELLTKPQ